MISPGQVRRLTAAMLCFPEATKCSSTFSSPHRFRMSLRSLGQSSGRALLGHQTHPSLESDIITLHHWPLVGTQKRPVHGPPPTAAGRFGPSNSDFSSPHRFRMSLRSLGQSSGRALLGHQTHPSLESDIITLHPWPMVGTQNAAYLRAFFYLHLSFLVERTKLENGRVVCYQPRLAGCESSTPYGLFNVILVSHMVTAESLHPCDVASCWVLNIKVTDNDD
jgi:hypothetical protein